MNKTTVDFSIIIPTFNEKDNILLLIKTIKNLKFTNLNYEIIVVDDNSPDGTYKEVIKKFGKDKVVKALLRENERGLAGAILHGIKNSKNEIVLGMDADFNHPPETIPQMIKELQTHDFVVASRFIKGGGMEEKKRYPPTFLFNWFLKHVLAFPTMDNMSGFYAIRKKELLKLPLEKIYKGYGEYHLRLVYLAGKNNLSIKEIPVFYKKRASGKSKSNLPKMLVLYLKEAFKLRFYEKKFGIQNTHFRT